MTRLIQMTLLTAVFFASACSQTPVQTADGHNSRLSLDWVGRYQAAVDCVDCTPVTTELMLMPVENNDSGAAIRTLSGQSEEMPVVTARGTYEWGSSGQHIEIRFPNEAPARFMVGENQLIPLDEQGRRRSDSRAEVYYRLASADALTGGMMPITWRLTSLNGLPVASEQSDPSPHITFADGQTMSGFAGCNRFGAQTTLQGNSLTFGQLFTTRRACFAPTVEPKMLDAVASVYRYRLVDPNTLHLFDEFGSLLMTFSAQR